MVKGLDSNWPHHPLFRGLDPHFLDILARTAVEERYERRALIFHEGEPADKFYIICSGRVAVEVFANERGPVTIETLGDDEVLGWSWLIEPYQWHFDAQVIDPTHLIAFDARRVREYLDAHPAFGYVLMSRFLPIIVHRMQATRLQLLDVYHVHT